MSRLPSSASSPAAPTLPGEPFASWQEAARGQSEESPRLPISVLIGEAIELSYFLEARWEPVEGDEEAGILPAPGMKSALAAGKMAPTLVGDLRELALAVGWAQAQFQACAPPTFVAPVERGKELLGELRECLGFLFDDGVRDDHDRSLARLTASHSDTSTHDALALSLDGFAYYAQEHRDQLALLPGFDPAILDEALETADRLRRQSALQLTAASRERRRDALALRNRLCSLLVTKTNELRRAARFVFRHHPDIVALCASTYARQRQARSRARRTEKADESPSS